MLSEKGVGVNALRKVSTHVTLRSLRRVTWAETFRCLWAFCMSSDHLTSCFSWVFDKKYLINVYIHNQVICLGRVQHGEH